MALTVKVAKARLARFLAANPHSSVGYTKDKELVVKAPWGEDALAISLTPKSNEIISVLNAVVLPERFTAIWHTDTEMFEIIYTAYPLVAAEAVVKTRSFEFVHDGKRYECSFGRSSERLLRIAEHYTTVAPSLTSFRNLPSFRRYITSHAKGSSIPPMPPMPGAEPVSFWIRGLKWNEDVALALVNHLNFYMTYYDSQSPVILVHAPRQENVAAQPQQRFRFGNFPKKISAKKLDDNLRHFWEASRRGDPVRRFLYSYQILEYAAFYYVEESIQKTIRKLLSAPNATDNIDRVTSQLIEACSESKLSDPQKIEALLRETVDPKLIWQDLALNTKFFSESTKFDGGFASAPLVKKDWTEADYVVNWVPAFAGTIRSIRNALSHGREQRMTSVITPTTKNFERLQHWVPPISTAAQEVMIYQGLA